MTQDLDGDFKRGMVVVAHADDAEFGCSGTVAKWCGEGWEVVYVLCTDGSKGSSDREISQRELSKVRHREQTEAGKVLGLKEVVFLDHEDSMLQPSLDLRRDIAREIRRHRPDVLICPYPMRNLDGEWGVGHPDHMAAGEAALSAVFPTARDHMTFPELLKDGLEPHKVAEVWVMGHPEPDLWIDVTDSIETSIKALAQHASQLGDRSGEETGKFMRQWRRSRAEGKGMQYAESFRRFVLDRRQPPPSSTDEEDEQSED
jgi:LmbE family N-acetylglucosaminyl deacetylase